MSDDCPYCGKKIYATDIMGDSDWDDQSEDQYETECPHCNKNITITQIDVEVIRHLLIEKT